MEGRSPSGRCRLDDSPQHPVPGVAPAYLESRIAIGERWKSILFQTRFFSAIKSKNDSNHSSDPNKKNSLIYE